MENFNTIADAKTSIDNSGLFEWINLDKVEDIYEWAFRNAKNMDDVKDFLMEHPEFCN